jgi:hypothetical protein
MSAVESRADPQEVLVLDETTLDRNLHYRWVQNDPRSIAKRSGQGYRFVSRKDDKVKMLIENGIPPDDRFYHMDTVLMCCERKRFTERRDRNREISAMRLRSPVSKFQQEHAASGVRNSKVLVDEEGE